MANPRHRKPNAEQWQGREDGGPNGRLFQYVGCQDIDQWSPSDSQNQYGIIGFACDEGVRRNHGRPGAYDGPAALRPYLAKLPMHLQKDTAIYDFGDVVCDDGDLEAAQKHLANPIEKMVRESVIPIVLGGGHETAWGHYQGLNQAEKTDNIAIINFDTHFDLRPVSTQGLGSSGTPFLQIANCAQQQQQAFQYAVLGLQRLGNTSQLFDTANTLNCKFRYADDFFEKPAANTIRFLDSILSTVDHVYLSICLDVFSQAHAPGVSAPQALGLDPWHVIPCLRHIAKSKKLLSVDIVEFAPCFDQGGNTARLASALVGDLLHALEG